MPNYAMMHTEGSNGGSMSRCLVLFAGLSLPIREHVTAPYIYFTRVTRSPVSLSLIVTLTH